MVHHHAAFIGLAIVVEVLPHDDVAVSVAVHITGGGHAPAELAVGLSTVHGPHRCGHQWIHGHGVVCQRIIHGDADGITAKGHLGGQRIAIGVPNAQFAVVKDLDRSGVGERDRVLPIIHGVKATGHGQEQFHRSGAVQPFMQDEILANAFGGVHMLHIERAVPCQRALFRSLHHGRGHRKEPIIGATDAMQQDGHGPWRLPFICGRKEHAVVPNGGLQPLRIGPLHMLGRGPTDRPFLQGWQRGQVGLGCQVFR